MAIFPPPGLLSDPPPAPGAAPDLHYYLSFRSPYTYIAAERVKALAGAYGAALKLRFVLPMVMRGMQVPRTKSIYILKDAADLMATATAADIFNARYAIYAIYAIHALCFVCYMLYDFHFH